MGLEAGTYVNDLVATNPVAGDPQSQGDDHLRLLKSTLRTTFPNASKPFYFPTLEAKSADFAPNAVTDNHKTFMVDTSSGDVTVTLPNAPSADTFLTFVKTTSANSLIIARSGSDTVMGATSHTITTQYASISLQKISSVTAWQSVAGAEVSTAFIKDEAVTTAKIDDGAVTLTKLAAAVQNLLVPVGTVSYFAGRADLFPAGWLPMTGVTLGNASSGADNQGDIYQALFSLLWTSISNSFLPILDSSGVATTRGAAWGDDWAANKRLPVPNDGISGANRFWRAADGATIAVGETQLASIESHVHTWESGTGVWTLAGLDSGPTYVFVSSTGVGTYNTGSYGSSETRPVNRAYTPIIKY